MSPPPRPAGTALEKLTVLSSQWEGSVRSVHHHPPARILQVLSEWLVGCHWKILAVCYPVALR